MSTPSAPGIKIIGVGNEYRGDDAVGILIARRLVSMLPNTVAVIEHSGDGATLMDQWRCAELVIIVDAAKSGAPVGTIHRLNPNKDIIPSDFFHHSSHAFAVAEAVEVARRLGLLPSELLIFGLEGTDYDAGSPLSPAVEQALTALTDEIVSLVTARLETT